MRGLRVLKPADDTVQPFDLKAEFLNRWDGFDPCTVEAALDATLAAQIEHDYYA